MPNRITGMYSGLDTESLIRDLVKARSAKVDKLKKEKTRTEWKQEAWTSLNTKLKNLFSKSVSAMRYRGDYAIKKTAVSNPNAVSVITGANAMNSVQSLSINKLASTGYLTGAEMTSAGDKKLTGESTLADLKVEGKAFSGSGSFSITVNGETTSIDVSSDTKISDLVSKLNSAGVNANFDEKHQRLFIGAKSSGKDADFTITANDGAGNQALSALGINAAPNKAAKEIYSQNKSYGEAFKYDAEGNFDADATKNNILSDTESDVYNKLMSMAKADYSARVDAAQKEYDKLEAEIKDLEAQADNEILTDEDKAKVNETLEAKRAEFDAKTTELEDMKINLAGNIYDPTSMNKALADLKGIVDFATQMDSMDAAKFNTGAVKLPGSDAEIELNGATFTSASNNVEVNGLTFTCLDVAKNITVTTTEDTDGVYNKIKDFLKEYNSIINEMDKLFNTKAKKGYDVLTEDEKDAMTDKEIEKWEDTVKASLLRNDDTLRGVFDGMKEVMASGIEIGGKTFYLSNFGINTASYFEAAEFEKAAYHIDGDLDDNLTGGKDDVLKSMIANDSETVIEFFSQLSNNLYSKMDKLSASSDYSSFGSYFDDKKYKTDISDIEKKIAEAEAKLAAYEDKWYSKFAAMEKALSKSDSSNQYLSGLFSK